MKQYQVYAWRGDREYTHSTMHVSAHDARQAKQRACFNFHLKEAEFSRVVEIEEDPNAPHTSHKIRRGLR